MNLSQYNIALSSGSQDGVFLLNAYTRAVCALRGTELNAIIDGKELSEQLKSVLVEMEALVNDPDEQREKAFDAAREEQHSGRQLTLVIPVTSGCNLQCIYCYQQLHGNFRGEASVKLSSWHAHSIASLIAFIRNKLSEKNYSELRIRWYGGEPLLRLDIIETIGSAIKTIAEEQGVKMTGMAVTNGALLNDTAIRVLQDVNVDRLEISIDGPAQTHNKLRPQANGAESYSEVMAGVLLTAKHFNQVIFRVNVHEINAEAIDDWLYKIADLIRNRNIYLKFKLVEGDPTNNLTWDRYCKLLLQYLLLAKKLGIALLQSRLSTEVCPAIRNNYYIVQSDLRIYKCPQNLGSSDFVGTIGTDGKVNFNKTLDIWEKYSINGNKDCRKCAHLPHCNGGCPYNQIMKKVNHKSLKTYQRKERCCCEKALPELLIPRVL